MKLHVQQTAEAGIEACYAALSDFDAILQTGKQGQMQLTRLDAPAPIGTESRWDGQLESHGICKPVSIKVATLSPPEGYVLSGQADGIKARFSVALTPISSAQTLVDAELTLRASSLTGKVLLKSLRLAQGRLEDRLTSRLARLLPG